MRWPVFVPLFGVLLLNSCAPVAGAAAPQAPLAVTLGEPFTLAAGATVRVGSERTGVTFEAVVADSRCPTDVQCIRAGEAVVRVTVARQRQPAETVEVQTTPNRDQVTAAGYTLTLTRLLPVPNTKTPTTVSDYRATFTLAKP